MEAFNIYFIVCVAVAFALGINSVFISNLDASCMQCLCQGATGCNTSLRCVKGYCGPFYISRVYWIDADKHVLLEDDPERDGAYGDCANEYNCAKVMVENYLAKFGKDCNGDGVTNCDDYAMVHFNGGYNCEASIEGKKFHQRYIKCRTSNNATATRTVEKRGTESGRQERIVGEHRHS